MQAKPDCAICLAELKGVSVTLCSHPAHLIHDHCAKKLIDQGGDKCPMCRTPIADSILNAKTNALAAKELHVTSDMKSIFVSLCKNMDRKNMPSADDLRKPACFLKHGLKEIRIEFNAEGKAQEKEIVSQGPLIIRLIAKELHTWLLDQFSTEYDLTQWSQYNEDENVNLIPKGNVPTFFAKIEGKKSIVIFKIYRTFLSEHPMVNGPYYYRKEDMNMWDYETAYCWGMQVAFLDAKEKKKTVAERLTSLHKFQI